MKCQKMIIISLAAFLAMAFVLYDLRPHPLSVLLAREIRSSKLISWEPMSVKQEILIHYDDNEDELFIDAIKLSKNAFISKSNSSNNTILILEFPVGAFGYKFLSMQKARLIFDLSRENISLLDASVMREMI